MALTDQPYLPLYVDDWLGNNKLKMCSAVAHGVMVNIMCLLHKSNDGYGKLLLNQKFKQTGNQIKDFALMVAKMCPFDLVEVEVGLTELISENVLVFDGDLLVSKRMVRDGELSVMRSESGKKGGIESVKSRKSFAQAKIKANNQANTENENGINNNIQIVKHSDNEGNFKPSGNFKSQGEEVFAFRASADATKPKPDRNTNSKGT